MPGEWSKLDKLAGELSTLVSRAAFDGTDACEVYYVLRTFEQSIGKAVEEKFGPERLASLQRAAFEQRLLQVHAIPTRGR